LVMAAAALYAPIRIVLFCWAMGQTAKKLELAAGPKITGSLLMVMSFRMAETAP